MVRHVTLICADGEPITLSTDCAGVTGGWGRIGNPYWDGDKEWRMKDGDTVIACSKDHPRALPIQDAYQELYRQFDAERAIWEGVEREHDARMVEADEAERWEPVEELYRIQDELGRE